MIVIKIYKRMNIAPHIVKIEEFPCDIGRSTRNHVIVDHDSISAEHATIQKGPEGFVLVDKDSTNGTWIDGKPEKQIPLLKNQTVFLGKIRVELLIDDEDMEATRKYDMVEEVTGRRPRVWKQLLAALIALCGSAGLEFYAYYGVENRWNEYLLKVCIGILVATAFAFGLSLFSKVQAGKYRFTPLLVPSLWAVVFAVIFDLVKDTLFFMIEWPWIRIALSFIIAIVVCYIFLGTLSQILFPRLERAKLRLRLGVTIAVCFTVYGLLTYLLSYDSPGFNYEGTVGYPLLPMSHNRYRIETLFMDMDSSAKTIQSYRSEDDEESY